MSSDKLSPEDADGAVAEFVKKVALHMGDHGLNQPELGELSGISQPELSNLLSQKKDKKDPGWKRLKCTVLKRPERMASLCSVLRLDDPELLGDVCKACGLLYEDVSAFMARRASVGFCPWPQCHGATFVPQGRSALVVPFEKRIRGTRQPTCSWCGEDLESQCPRAE